MSTYKTEYYIKRPRSVQSIIEAIGWTLYICFNIFKCDTCCNSVAHASIIRNTTSESLQKFTFIRYQKHFHAQ